MTDGLVHPDRPVLASGLVQRRADRDGNGVAAAAEASVGRASGAAGTPLPDPIRERFEASLGADLGAVRVHTDDASAEAAHAVGARAYTLGQDIHFAHGTYAPDTGDGLHLLAHEVAHTVQQASGAPVRQNKLEVSTTHDPAEAEADAAADAMVAGRSATVGAAGGAAQRKVHRDKAPEPQGPTQGKFYTLNNPGQYPKAGNAITWSTEGLFDAVVATGAFDDVPENAPLWATLRKLCSTDLWQIPNQAKTENLSAERLGMKGSWNVTITPQLSGVAFLGPGQPCKVVSSSSTSTSSGGGQTSGTEAKASAGVEGQSGPNAGVEAGVTEGSSSSHGGGYSGGTTIEMESPTQKFVGLVLFSISVKGHWSKSLGNRFLGAISTGGLSLIGDAAVDAAQDEGLLAKNGSGRFPAAIQFTAPTDACTKVC